MAQDRAAIASAVCVAIALLVGDVRAEEQALQSDALATYGLVDPESFGRTGSDSHKIIADITPWKRITIGTYKGPNAIRAALEAAGMRIGDSADEILGRPAFPFSKTKTELDLVVATAVDLGLGNGRASLAQIYRRAVQLGLDLCPAEVGPQLRLQYATQPVGEFLHVAMQPIATYHGDLVDLTVANGGAGLLLLGGDGSPDLKFYSTVKFVFIRPPRIAMPNAR